MDETILYHAGHFGYIIRFIAHHLTEYPKSNVIIAVDTSSMPDKAAEYIKSLQPRLRDNIKFIFYTDRVFYDYQDTNSLRNAIESTFDQFLSSNDVNIDTVSKIYSGYDSQNAFCMYLIMKKRHFTLCDFSGETVQKSRSGKSPASRAYSVLQKNIYYKNELVDEVIWFHPPREPIEKKQTLYDLPKKIRSLSEYDKNWIIHLYSLDDLVFNKTINVIMFRAGRTGFTKRDFVFYHKIICECIGIEPTDFIVKCHPRYVLSANLIKDIFPNSTIISAYAPAEVLNIIPNLRINNLITSSNSTNVDISDRQIILPYESVPYFKFFSKTIVAAHLCAGNNIVPIYPNKDEIYGLYDIIINNCPLHPSLSNSNILSKTIIFDDADELAKKFDTGQMFLITNIDEHIFLLLDSAIIPHVFVIQIETRNLVERRDYMAIITNEPNFSFSFTYELKLSGIKIKTTTIPGRKILNKILESSATFKAYKEYQNVQTLISNHNK